MLKIKYPFIEYMKKILISLFLLAYSSIIFAYTSYFNFGFWNKCSQERTSCKAHQAAGCNGSGNYPVDVDFVGKGLNGFRTTCDMSSNPAWTEISSGLIAYYKFDTYSSPNIINEIGSANVQASLVGLPVAGKRNNALQMITIYGQTIPVSNTMTVCSWQKGSWSSSYYGIGRKSGNVAYGSTAWYRLSHFGYFTGVAQVTDGPSSPNVVMTDGLWHHYCTTLDNTITTAKTYIDGVLASSFTNVTRWNSYGTALYTLGDETVDTVPTGSAPLLDEYRIYNRVLSVEEIRVLAQQDIFNGDLISNGDFSNGTTSWTGSYGTYNYTGSNAGTVSVSTGTTGTNYFRQTITTVPGASYKVTFTVKSISGGTGIIFESHAMISTENPRDGVKLSQSANCTSPGTYSYNFTATTTSTQIVLATEVNTGNSVVDDFKVIKN